MYSPGFTCQSASQELESRPVVAALKWCLGSYVRRKGTAWIRCIDFRVMCARIMSAWQSLQMLTVALIVLKTRSTHAMIIPPHARSSCNAHKLGGVV